MIRLLESVLPGLRDARTPLVAGLAWSLLAWLLVADRIPAAGEATGFARQVYALSDALGPGPTLAALGVTAYLVGILGVTFAQGLSGAAIALQRYLQWQGRARRAHRACEQDVQDAVAQAEQAAGTAAEKGARQTLERHRATLADFTRSRLAAGLLYRRTATIVGHVRAREPRGYHRLAQVAADNAWVSGLEAELARLGPLPNDFPEEDTRSGAYHLVDQLIDHDLGPDPLDALHALDDGLYQALDRERAERDFRIGITPPLFAVSLYVATSLPAAFLVAILALWTFRRATAQGSEETARVLRQIILKGLPLPSLRAAEAEGRASVRESLRTLAKAPERVARPAQS